MLAPYRLIVIEILIRLDMPGSGAGNCVARGAGVSAGIYAKPTFLPNQMARDRASLCLLNGRQPSWVSVTPK